MPAVWDAVVFAVCSGNRDDQQRDGSRFFTFTSLRRHTQMTSRVRASARAPLLHLNHLCSCSTRSGGSRGTCSSAALAVSCRPRRLEAASQVTARPRSRRPPHVGVLHQAKARPRSRRPIRGSAQLPTCAPHSSTCSTVARARFVARDAPPPQPPLLAFDSFWRLTRHLQQRRASSLLPSTTARGC